MGKVKVGKRWDFYNSVENDEKTIRLGKGAQTQKSLIMQMGPPSETG